MLDQQHIYPEARVHTLGRLPVWFQYQAYILSYIFRTFFDNRGLNNSES